MSLNFRDTAIAFKSHSTRSLRRSKWLFFILSKSFLVNFGKSLTLIAFSLRLPINVIILKTVFKQFCGGQTVGDSNEVIAHNWQHKVGSILDYSVEGQFNELGFEQTKKAIFETLTLVNSNPGVPLGVFKVTGLVETSLLKKVSSNSVLSIPESKAWEKGKTRIDDILNYAHSLNVPIMIDAEESWIQNAIDEIAERGMGFYNKKNAIVFNTIQCYKTDQLAHLKKSMARAKHNGYKYGVKLVRGAYMEKENTRAKELNYKTPIQPSKDHTDSQFNECIEFILENLGSPQNNGDINLIIGTHNEESVIFAVNKLREKKWPNSDAPVWFAQLYGMSDNISFNLANQGYKVAKYLPFGPIKEVIPYLFRRAEENTSVKGQTARELSLINKELARRKKLII